MKSFPIKMVSWYLDSLPDYIWMVLGLQPSLRQRFFKAFRDINFVLNRDGKPYVRLTMQGLAELDDEFFERLIQPIKRDPRLFVQMSALSGLSGFPGEIRWKGHFPKAPRNFNFTIERACRYATPQDGRPATDIAFLNAMCDLLQGKLHVPRDMLTYEKVNLYVTDPESAGLDGSIRALRNASAMVSPDAPHQDLPRSEWVNDFYKWGREQTYCRGYNLIPDEDEPLQKHADDVFQLIQEVRSNALDGLISDFKTFGQNEIREASCGLAAYACDLSFAIVSGSVLSHSAGMVLARTIAEVLILITHISHDESGSEAVRYRAYGAGRAKLLVNKIQELGEGASGFISSEFSHVANEKYDEMFINMPIGSFYIPNIRDVAIKCGAKDVYDKFFDISSAFVHAEWGAVGSSSTQMCMNPLHLGHYVPAQRLFPVELMADVHWLMVGINSRLTHTRDFSSGHSI
jgi:hypothetical protein